MEEEHDSLYEYVSQVWFTEFEPKINFPITIFNDSSPETSLLEDLDVQNEEDILPYTEIFKADEDYQRGLQKKAIQHWKERCFKHSSYKADLKVIKRQFKYIRERSNESKRCGPNLIFKKKKMLLDLWRFKTQETTQARLAQNQLQNSFEIDFSGYNLSKDLGFETQLDSYPSLNSFDDQLRVDLQNQEDREAYTTAVKLHMQSLYRRWRRRLTELKEFNTYLLNQQEFTRLGNRDLIQNFILPKWRYRVNLTAFDTQTSNIKNALLTDIAKQMFFKWLSVIRENRAQHETIISKRKRKLIKEWCNKVRSSRNSARAYQPIPRIIASPSISTHFSTTSYTATQMPPRSYSNLLLNSNSTNLIMNYTSDDYRRKNLLRRYFQKMTRHYSKMKRYTEAISNFSELNDADLNDDAVTLLLVQRLKKRQAELKKSTFIVWWKKHLAVKRLENYADQHLSKTKFLPRRVFQKWKSSALAKRSAAAINSQHELDTKPEVYVSDLNKKFKQLTLKKTGFAMGKKLEYYKKVSPYFKHWRDSTMVKQRQQQDDYNVSKILGKKIVFTKVMNSWNQYTKLRKDGL